MRDVTPQRSVDGRTVRTYQDASVHDRPSRVTAATVCTDGERMTGFGFAEHDDDMLSRTLTGVKHSLVI